jgi:hypothetical protein
VKLSIVGTNFYSIRCKELARSDNTEKFGPLVGKLTLGGLRLACSEIDGSLGGLRLACSVIDTKFDTVCIMLYTQSLKD